MFKPSKYSENCVKFFLGVRLKDSSTISILKDSQRDLSLTISSAIAEFTNTLVKTSVQIKTQIRTQVISTLHSVELGYLKKKAYRTRSFMISRRNSVEIVPFADNKACLFSGKPVSEGYKNAPDFINVYARQMLSSGSTRCRTKHTMPSNNQNLSKILLMRDCLFQLCKTTAKFRDFK